MNQLIGALDVDGNGALEYFDFLEMLTGERPVEVEALVKDEGNLERFLEASSALLGPPDKPLERIQSVCSYHAEEEAVTVAAAISSSGSLSLHQLPSLRHSRSIPIAGLLELADISGDMEGKEAEGGTIQTLAPSEEFASAPLNLSHVGGCQDHMAANSPFRRKSRV